MAIPALPLPVSVADNKPIYGILYDIHAPSQRNGGIQINIPAGHAHAGRGNGYYYRCITGRLQALGYNNVEYSAWSKQTTSALAIADACNLQTDPN